MKTLIFLVVIFTALSCKKSNPPTPPVDISRTVQGSMHHGTGTDGKAYLKPGIVLNNGVYDVSGKVTLQCYIGKIIGRPAYSFSQTLNFSITDNQKEYFELSTHLSFNEPIDSVKITNWAVVTGEYNYTIIY